MTEKYLKLIANASLFKGVNETKLVHLLSCLKAVTRSCHPDEHIFTQGMPVSYIYIILEGQIELSKSTLSGQKNIVSVLRPGRIFGEGIVCTMSRLSPVSALCLTDTMLLCIPYQHIIGGCEHGCSFHHQLIYNMMILLGEKNYHLNTKIDLLLIKGMREKLTTYLLLEAEKNKSTSFILHLNRGQLAEYLNVSRPSMCRELGRMKEEGLIDYYQNSFKLIDLAELVTFPH